MAVRVRNSAGFFLGILMFLSITGVAVALDEIVLNGIVRFIDLKERVVYIDVKSADCMRQKTFRFSEQDAQRVGALQVGQELRFATDRFRCADQSPSVFIPDIPGGKK